jgi:hypothetical protein
VRTPKSLLKTCWAGSAHTVCGWQDPVSARPDHTRQLRRGLTMCLVCVLPARAAAAAVVAAVHRQSILDVCGQVPPEAIKDLVAACKSGMYSRVQQQVRQVNGSVRCKSCAA